MIMLPLRRKNRINQRTKISFLPFVAMTAAVVGVTFFSTFPPRSWMAAFSLALSTLPSSTKHRFFRGWLAPFDDWELQEECLRLQQCKD